MRFTVGLALSSWPIVSSNTWYRYTCLFTGGSTCKFPFDCLKAHVGEGEKTVQAQWGRVFSERSTCVKTQLLPIFGSKFLLLCYLKYLSLL
uniref:Macaca fascicularis brain cDNA, clone: QmoA-11787 n=1 Tax=Macaca fascicularis TaxID=9541 RepID=I7GN82_MACFA|nr:unnamed protein product [Macaca fascicularis]